MNKSEEIRRINLIKHIVKRKKKFNTPRLNTNKDLVKYTDHLRQRIAIRDGNLHKAFSMELMSAVKTLYIRFQTSLIIKDLNTRLKRLYHSPLKVGNRTLETRSIELAQSVLIRAIDSMLVTSNDIDLSAPANSKWRHFFSFLEDKDLKKNKELKDLFYQDFKKVFKNWKAIAEKKLGKRGGIESAINDYLQSIVEDEKHPGFKIFKYLGFKKPGSITYENITRRLNPARKVKIIN